MALFAVLIELNRTRRKRNRCKVVGKAIQNYFESFSSNGPRFIHAYEFDNPHERTLLVVIAKYDSTNINYSYRVGDDAGRRYVGRYPLVSATAKDREAALYPETTEQIKDKIGKAVADRVTDAAVLIPGHTPDATASFPLTRKYLR